MADAAPEVLLLAGPNGAGKTTSSRLLIPERVVFVNADSVARHLADRGHPSAGLDVAAGRIV
ncbi:MAG: Zeta toxin family protein, partial [Acidimicrobiales bacterium]